MRPHSVKFRLTLWYALVLTILLSVFAFLMYAELSRALYRDIDKSLIHEAATLEESMQSYLEGIFRGVSLAEEERFPPSFFSFPPELKLKVIEVVQDWEKASQAVSRSTAMIRMAGLDHSVIVGNLSGWERDIIFPDFERDSVFMETGESFQTIHFHRKPIRLYYRLIRTHQRPLLILQAASSIVEVKRALQRLAFIILISIPGAVVAACIAGWFLAKRSLLPIDLMIREARQISAAYLDARLPRSHAGDELDRLAETLNEMMGRIESSTHAVQELCSDISHELKTPLAIIRGEIDVALRRSRSPEDLVKTLHVITGEVNELIRLVDDLMLLVRSDAKQLRFDKKKVALARILEQSTERFKERARNKKIDLSLDPKEEADIQADEIYIKRLFSNLLDNALKFTPEGGRVRVGVKRGARFATVEVLDTGIGIEREAQSKVFSRFYRTDQARSYEGAGLGLNIAKAICEAHDGTIQIKSEPNEGTTVTVHFPLYLD